MAKRRRWKVRSPDPDRHPVTRERVQDLSSTQLQERLVKDAVKGFPEGESEAVSASYLMWFTEAVIRISRLDQIGIDDAYLRVRQEVASLGGVMPTAPGS